MGAGSTVVLSECNSGRDKILGEGMVGLARGFLFAGAAATVVSLWSVDDGSTAALMEQMYKHLEDGRTTAQALRLAMLHLLHGRSESSQNSRWRRPLYWAAFLVVGANTRLPPTHLQSRSASKTVPRMARLAPARVCSTLRCVHFSAYTPLFSSPIPTCTVSVCVCTHLRVPRKRNRHKPSQERRRIPQVYESRRSPRKSN